jgi:hypothetical protein
VLIRLERAYLESAARSLLLRSALEAVLGALAAASVPAMPLKGAALAGRIYPDPALREMTDLDVLVPAGTLDAANAALAGVGYRSAYPATSPWGRPAWMRAHHHHDPPLVDRGGRISVELHHHLVGPDRAAGLRIADVWRRGGPGRMPAAEDLLLHACLHFTVNRAVRSDGSLAQVADIAWIVHREEIDWPGFTAAAAGVSPGVYLALFAARELGVAVPDAPLGALRPAGFDVRLGHRLVELRVLRAAPCFPAASLRTMLAAAIASPARHRADPVATTRGQGCRRPVRIPPPGSWLGKPGAVVRDYRLNRWIRALESRPSGLP